MMNKITGIGFACFVSVLTFAPLQIRGDKIISHDEMNVSYGGGPGTGIPTPGNGLCCAPINACAQVNNQRCSEKNSTSQAGCTGYAEYVVQTQYQNKCQTPNPAVPNADCADFQNDSTGRSYRCVAAFKCKWDNITNVCSKGVVDDNSAVFGYYSCGSNCPASTVP